MKKGADISMFLAEPSSEQWLIHESPQPQCRRQHPLRKLLFFSPLCVESMAQAQSMSTSVAVSISGIHCSHHESSDVGI